MGYIYSKLDALISLFTSKFTYYAH